MASVACEPRGGALVKVNEDGRKNTCGNPPLPELFYLISIHQYLLQSSMYFFIQTITIIGFPTSLAICYPR
jgi:hypothetical protein